MGAYIKDRKNREGFEIISAKPLYISEQQNINPAPAWNHSGLGVHYHQEQLIFISDLQLLFLTVKVNFVSL